VAKEENIIELMQECIAEDMEAMREVIEEDLMPLIKYRQEEERKILDKALKEVQDLEREEV